MTMDPAAQADRIVRHVRDHPPASGRRLHALVVRSDADDFHIWHEILVVRVRSGVTDATEENIDGVGFGFDHGRGKRLAAEVAYRAAQALGVPAFVDEWKGGTPYVHRFPTALEVPRFPELGWRALVDAVAAVPLPPGFVQQLSGIDDDAWLRATPRCLQEDLRLAMLVKEHAPLLDRRAFVVAELDGSMCVWAALALAQAGFAPLFVCGPELHRGHAWSKVIGALKHVAHPLVRALQQLDEGAPVAVIADRDADVLTKTRTIDEAAALPDLPESLLPPIRFESKRRHIVERWEQQQRDRRRVVYPRPAEVAAHHACVVYVRSVTDGDSALVPPAEPAGGRAAGELASFTLRLNPFVDPVR